MTKTVLVYGTGISGCGAADALAKQGCRVLLYSDKETKIDNALLELLKKQGGGLYCGNGETLLQEVEQIVLSPGIPLANPLTDMAVQMGIEVISEVEAAYRSYHGHIIGITGTNGKTTTTTLVGEMLKTLPVPTAVGGNIGQALSKEVENLGADAWLAAELSSFQLEGVREFRPDVAVILNLTPDHLDRHHTMEAYGAAKCNIFKKQRENDIVILIYDDPIIRGWGELAPSRVCWFSRREQLNRGVYLNGGNFTIAWDRQLYTVCHKKDLRVFGGHNEENVLAAIAACFFAGVTIENMRRVLLDFTGVEHRLEYVMTVNGVPYYNDSKATNPDSTIKALEAFDGHIILLAGGHDKMTSLEPMMKLVQAKADVLILLGEAKERFYEAAAAAGVGDIRKVETMDEAVELAYKLAAAPQVVLLSPACSSYDMFENFPARGRYFKNLVAALPK